jgi:hypothetical protein
MNTTSAGRKLNETNTYAFKVNGEVIKVRSRNQVNAVATVAKQLGLTNDKLRKVGEVAIVIAGLDLNFKRIY